MKGLTMNEVKAPPEFRKLVSAFYQGSRKEAKDNREWIALALRCLDRADKLAVRQFLAELLREEPGEAKLQKIWNSVGSNYHIVGKNGHEAMREFLTMIRDQIE
jgi:hypothetical protein